jgi:hypothetical protein
MCRYCDLRGLVVPATLVDHLYPHKGNRQIFWLTSLWVSSCDQCHSRFKQRVELEGIAAIDALAQQLGLPTLRQLLPEGVIND